MAIPDPESLLSFFSRELKQDAKIAFILVLGLLCGAFGYIAIWQNGRIEKLQEEKFILTTDLLREQIRTDKKIDVIQEELKKTTETLENLQRQNETDERKRRR